MHFEPATYTPKANLMQSFGLLRTCLWLMVLHLSEELCWSKEVLMLRANLCNRQNKKADKQEKNPQPSKTFLHAGWPKINWVIYHHYLRSREKNYFSSRRSSGWKWKRRHTCQRPHSTVSGIRSLPELACHPALLAFEHRVRAHFL